MREEIIGNARLILGDCREVLPTLSQVDACITDPPYGINKDGQKQSSGKHGGRKAYEFKNWDDCRPSVEIFDLIRKISKTQIIWGGNYFADMLPATGKWLVWDKGQRINQSDGELAYTSIDGALRIFTLNRVALMTDGAEHPTQKPLALMKWCLSHLPDGTKTIMDPYMGSGTTGCAVVQSGRSFVGIELDPDYFSIACRRIEHAQRQADLFVAAPAAPAPTTMDMFAGLPK